MSNWRKDAACRGMNTKLFFEEYETNVRVQMQVDKICKNCPVQEPCLEYAYKNKVEGGVFARKYFKQKKKKSKVKI